MLKKILTASLVLITVLIIAILVYAYSALNCISDDDSAITINTNDLVYFQNSYNDCRNRFIEISQNTAREVKGSWLKEIAVSSTSGSDMYIDMLYFPAVSKKEKLYIISSGIHGVEGFTGSAIQQMIIREIVPEIDKSNIGFLFIHGINPWGFKNLRRVTENNVDLNRNSDTDRGLFGLRNEGYAELNAFLNPTEKLDTDSIPNRFFMLRAIKIIAFSSMKVLRQAILQGQYKFSDGIYYGGSDFEPQIKALKPFLREITREYSVALSIDLHTGYGERGTVHLFPSPAENSIIRKKIERAFHGYRIDWGDSDDFYTVTGDFSTLPGKLAPTTLFLPMCFEYGTMNSQTIAGSVRSLHIMIMENQGFHYGYKDEIDKEKITSMIKEMYYPSSDRWRSKIISDSREIMKDVIKNF